MHFTGIDVIRSGTDIPVANPIAAEQNVELTYGDTLRVNISLEYRGSAQTVTLYGAIGVRAPLSFEEKVFGEATLQLPNSLISFSPVSGSVDIPITADINPGTDYDLYVKIKEYPGEGMPEVDDVIDIIGIHPSYDLIYEHLYHLAYIYDGEFDSGVLSFTVPTYAGEWWGEPLANAIESKVREQGGRVLEIRVYADTSAIIWTNFKIEFIGIPPSGVAGVGIGIAFWLAILISALAIIAIVLVTYKYWIEPLTRSPTVSLEDMKPTWGKEALILDIQDSEKVFERPVTPEEELEGMSESELRDYLDQIAEEEVPSKGISWWAIGIGAGVALIGIGLLTGTDKRSSK